MTDDIVTRLREYIPALNATNIPQAFIDMRKAANEIEKWRKIARDLYIVGCHSPDCGHWDDLDCGCTYRFAEEAYEEAANV